MTMPGDDDWLIDDEEGFDPLEDAPPIDGPGYEAEAPKAPTGTPEEVSAQWDAVRWQEAEKGRGEGYTMQRFRDPKQHYARVTFTFTEQPPPHSRIETAAGTVWRLENTRVRGKTIDAFYVRIPHGKARS